MNEPDLKGRKILIVDDDRLNIRILRGILQGEGFGLEDAATGEEALIKYATFQPDLVLLDVLMPGIDGFETCRRLRAEHGDNAAPIIFITAKAESEDVVEGLAAGGVDYLPKPFRAKEAVARIRNHLQTRILVEQLSKANAAKNRFLGMAAHDLRNPLASIRGLAEFLEDPMLGELNAEQKDLVVTIQQTSNSMLAMVNDLLDVATIESGELKLSRAKGMLSSIIERSVSFANIDASRKSTTVVLVPFEVEYEVDIDRAKMQQVVDNLLSNGVKYSPPGSKIEIGITATPEGMQFAVRDQGPGIPEGERDRLFKDFGRLSVQPTGGEKSTGLGLAICRKIVEAHGGTVTATNLVGKGCEFRVTLPL